MGLPRRPRARAKELDENQPLTRNVLRGPTARGRARQSPEEQTNAESFYYVKQMNLRTPIVVVMSDGEEFRGTLEWYDRTCLKLRRNDGPNLLIQKQWVKYLYKVESSDRG